MLIKLLLTLLMLVLHVIELIFKLVDFILLKPHHELKAFLNFSRLLRFKPLSLFVPIVLLVIIIFFIYSCLIMATANHRCSSRWAKQWLSLIRLLLGIVIIRCVILLVYCLGSNMGVKVCTCHRLIAAAAAIYDDDHDDQEKDRTANDEPEEVIL